MQLLGSSVVLEGALSLVQRMGPLTWPVDGCESATSPNIMQGKCGIFLGSAKMWKQAQLFSAFKVRSTCMDTACGLGADRQPAAGSWSVPAGAAYAAWMPMLAATTPIYAHVIGTHPCLCEREYTHACVKGNTPMLV
eukprot:366002-Chlamydomonas_euryale.AAC.8